jgi:hypothetical protein
LLIASVFCVSRFFSMLFRRCSFSSTLYSPIVSSFNLLFSIAINPNNFSSFTNPSSRASKLSLHVLNRTVSNRMLFFHPISFRKFQILQNFFPRKTFRFVLPSTFPVSSSFTTEKRNPTRFSSQFFKWNRKIFICFSFFSP